MVSVDREFFSRLITEILEKKGWRQIDLAEYLNISPRSRAHISHWITKHGEILPSRFHLAKLAKAHGGYTADQLLRMHTLIRLNVRGMEEVTTISPGEVLSKDEQVLIALARVKDVAGMMRWIVEHTGEESAKGRKPRKSRKSQ